MLNQFSLNKKLLVLTGIPLIAAILFAIMLIVKANNTASNANSISQLMQLAVANSQLVHELQKERGLTAGFYGSGASTEFKQKLEAQRQLTNKTKSARLKMIEELASVLN